MATHQGSSEILILCIITFSNRNKVIVLGRGMAPDDSLLLSRAMEMWVGSGQCSTLALSPKARPGQGSSEKQDPYC